MHVHIMCCIYINSIIFLENLGISAIYSNLPTSDGVNCLSFGLNGVVNTKQEHLSEQCCAYTANILTYDDYMTFKSLSMEAFLGINFKNMPWTIESIGKPVKVFMVYFILLIKGNFHFLKCLKS